MKKIVVLFLLFIGVTFVHAQEDKEKNNDLKLSTLPYYSYGSGLGLTSPGSLFQLNLRFRMQNRLTFIMKRRRGGSL